jgi:hypothetical protein
MLDFQLIPPTGLKNHYSNVYFTGTSNGMIHKMFCQTKESQAKHLCMPLGLQKKRVAETTEATGSIACSDVYYKIDSIRLLTLPCDRV